MKNKNTVQESEPEGRQIVFRVRVKKGFEGAGSWREFEVEDLFDGQAESGTMHGAFDWKTKSLRSPWKDMNGKYLFEGDIIKQEKIIFSCAPVEFADAWGIIIWCKDGFKIVPLNDRLIPEPTKSSVMNTRFDTIRCPVCDGKQKFGIRCPPECAGLWARCQQRPGCPGMIEEPCPVCGGG